MLLSLLWLLAGWFCSHAGVHAGVESGLPVRGDVWSPEQDEEFRLIGALSGVKRKIVSATAQLDEIDQESASSTKTKQAMRLEQLDDTFKAIASGVEDLESIQAQVEGSAELAEPIKEQVMWNLRKMKSDVERLQGSALDPLQREAIEKALELRFSVLLSPAFWQQAVDRSLLA